MIYVSIGIDTKALVIPRWAYIRKETAKNTKSFNISYVVGEGGGNRTLNGAL